MGFWLQLLAGVGIVAAGAAWMVSNGAYAMQPAVVICIGLTLIPIRVIGLLGGLAMFGVGAYFLWGNRGASMGMAIGALLMVFGVWTMVERWKRLGTG